MALKGKIAIFVLVGIVVAWFVYTNEQFLAEKRAQKALETVDEIVDETVEEMVEETVEMAETVEEEILEEPVVETDIGEVDVIECMKMASEQSHGDAERFKEILDECKQG